MRSENHERDWVEDFTHENGNYTCHCMACGNYFTGHKRRVKCKLCASISQPKEQEKEKTAEGILDQLGGSYFNGIAKSTIIEAMEAYASQQTTIKDTRISELEARVKELEVALSEAKRTIKNWHDISGGKEWDIYNKHSPEMKTINNALKVNKDGNY